MMNKTIKRVLQFSTLLAVLALAGCSIFTTPEVTVRAFFQGLNDSNEGAVLDTISPSSSFANATLSQIRSTFPDTNYVVVTVTTSDDNRTATVRATSTSFPTGRTYTFTMDEDVGGSIFGSAYLIRSWSVSSS